MAHDFDAAIADYEKLEQSYGHPIDTVRAAVFALRFTKAALSGEVGHEVWKAGFTSCDTEAMSKDTGCNDIFKAMCAELAKEVGNG